MKRFLSLAPALLALFATRTYVYAEDARSLMLVQNGESSAMSSTDVSVKDNFLKTVQVYLLSAYSLVAIGSLIYIGFRLFSARGNEQEFKQAWIALLYTVLGLAIAPLAYVIVRIVTGFSIS